MVKRMEGRSGFLYVSYDEDEPLSLIQAGAIVQNETRKPPWIIVDHTIESITIAHYPGTLWSVEVIDPATEEDFKAVGTSGLLPTATYTRSIAVKVHQALPLSLLFGPQGEAICKILETIDRLTEVQAEAFARHLNATATTVYSEAWTRWLKHEDARSVYLNQSHPNTLGVPGHRHHSPIGKGFYVIHQQVWNQAKKLTQGAALIVDEDGDMTLNPVWSAANTACLQVAMSYGAKDWLSEVERSILCAAWDAVFEDRI
jgi:hypothetical protein